MDKNELIKYRGNYTTEELAQILNVDNSDVIKWEETGEIDEQTYIYLKEIYEEECNIPNYAKQLVEYKNKPIKGLIIWNRIPYPLFVLVIFLVLGFVKDWWHPAWTVFLTIPVYYSLGSSIFRRSLALFNYPCIIIGIYALLGFICDLWSPGWILFLTIPLYYLICFNIAARKVTFVVYANIVLIVYLFIGMEFKLWHPWWVLFLTIITYFNISKMISYKYFWFFDVYPIVILIYILCGVFNNMWATLWPILLLILIYHPIQLYFIIKRKKKLHIIK